MCENVKAFKSYRITDRRTRPKLYIHHAAWRVVNSIGGGNRVWIGQPVETLICSRAGSRVVTYHVSQRLPPRHTGDANIDSL